MSALFTPHAAPILQSETIVAPPVVEVVAAVENIYHSRRQGDLFMPLSRNNNFFLSRLSSLPRKGPEDELEEKCPMADLSAD